MKDNFYITTPIYYPSAKPHMGHAYSSIVADFFARLKRIQGHNVFFLTGTDEHGQKIQRAAEKSNKDPLKFCDEISKTFRNLSSILNLSNDDFINKENIELNNLDVNFLLNYIFNKRNYLKDEFIIENLQILIEIYFYNKIISRNNFENEYKSFKQTMNKINNMNKFNLDKDSSLLEIKNIIVNER